MERKRKVIAVSGGFDPLHGGHLAMFQEAATYGDLYVIINSDEWLVRKKGFVFLPYAERMEIISSFPFVYDIRCADDNDGTVTETLKYLKPDYFANGGDRLATNTPEKAICEQLGIKMLYNIGGEKTNSSSAIAQRAWVKRPWGEYKALDEGEHYKVKKLVIDPGQSISLQKHKYRKEHWQIVGGKADVLLRNLKYTLKEGDHITVPAYAMHKLANKQDTPLVVIEIQLGHYLGEDDIHRFEEVTR
jgi:cytidyltransferase-like protein